MVKEKSLEPSELSRFYVPTLFDMFRSFSVYTSLLLKFYLDLILTVVALVLTDAMFGAKNDLSVRSQNATI